MIKPLASRLLWACLILALALSGCSGPGPAPAPTAGPTSQAGASPTGAEATPTEAPTATPTPPPPMAVLLAPNGPQDPLAAALEPALADLAAQAGLLFETRSALTPEEIQASSVQIVVALPPDPGLAALAAAAPQVQFLALAVPGLQAGGNLSLVQTADGQPDLQGFMAGYLAALITPDWRVGVISEAGSPAGAQAAAAFDNGAVYYCGLCRPVYPPYPLQGFPLAAEFTPGAGEAAWQTSIAEFKTWGVETVFVYSTTPDEAFLSFLSGAGFKLISTTTPPAGLQAGWVASIASAGPLGAVEELWPALLAGEGGQHVELLLALENVNPELLTPGRQALAEATLAELQAGLIDPGPVSGE